MAKEIERKFLVSPDWKKKLDTDSERFEIYHREVLVQGYLSLSSPTVRVRISHPKHFLPGENSSEKECHLCIKGKQTGISRDEYEFPVIYPDAGRLLKLCEQRIIKKIRYYIQPYTYLSKSDTYKQLGYTITVDELQGRHKGIILAEIELSKPSQKIEIPSWFGKEVSTDFEYTNQYIATNL